jgi:hypothetical protein
MRLRLLYFVALVASFFSLDAHAAGSCAKLMKRQAAFAAAPLHQKIKSITTPKSPTQLNEDIVKRFWRFTLPYLTKQAATSSMSLSDLVGEYFSMYELVMAEVDPLAAGRLAATRESFISSAQSLEKLTYDKKIIPNDLEPIRQFLSGLQHLAQGLAVFDVLAGRSEIRIDPRTVDRPSTIRDMIEAFEVHTLDTVVANFDRLKDQIRLRELETARLADEEVPEEEPMAYETNFAAVVREELPIQANFQYQITNGRGEEMNVVLSDDVIEHLDGSDQKILIYKLLRSLLTGQSGKSGLKTLFDTGPKIVEVKAVFHSHKRLLGCLEGRNLRLLELVELPTSKAGYSRRIPKNYCQ